MSKKAIWKIGVLFCVFLNMTLLSGCQREFSQLSMPTSRDTVAEIVVRDYGTIHIRLFEKLAPKAVENFVTHAKDGYYDGLPLYRIIEDSIIEGGDPTGSGNGGESIWDENFKDEFTSELQPYYGALCMSNSGPDTNGSRFFIVISKQTYNESLLKQIEQQYNVEFDQKARELYGKIGGAPWFYHLNTVFGQVYAGNDVLSDIAKVEKKNKETGTPAKEVIVEKVNILTYK